MVLKIIILLMFSPILLFVIHLLVNRLILFFKMNISGQRLLIYCIILFQPFLFFILLIQFPISKNIITYLYGFLVFNSFAYFYFHFFNMSETARRIKLLIGIHSDKIHSQKDINKYYKYEQTLDIRFLRLIQLKQIKEVNKNEYRLQSKILYWAAFLIIIFRSILGMKKIKAL